MFETNTLILNEIKERLKDYKNIFWVIGGACSGKSTVTKAIAEERGIERYDMDEYIYGHYGERYTMDRHPAIKTWFSAGNSLGWIMGLSEGEFDALNRATNVEFLDLFAEDMAKRDPNKVLLVDGGITHPSVLGEVLAVEQIVCLDVDIEVSRRIWNEDAERAQMKEWIHALPEGERAWEKFLGFDAVITETMLRESEEMGVEIVKRGRKGLGALVRKYFSL